MAQAAGAEVVDSLYQRLPALNPKTGFGAGKVEEIAHRLAIAGATLCIVDFDLTPSQGRNLEKALDVRVVDRTELILDIFSTRARTRQAKLQVELAQLQYMKSRLKRMWTHLERMEGAIGTRGPGETQLETDRRLVSKKISDIKSRLSSIENRSRRRAESRLDPHTVSLVGYTNAGKSTLLSCLSGSKTYIANQLFATLDTKVRYWVLEDKRIVMLADTVGFVRDLPHHLVASFHATLEETINADLLLHVCDSSSPDLELQMKAVDEVLIKLGNISQPCILVFNKIDRVDFAQESWLREQYPDAVFVSAIDGNGLDTLDAVLASTLDRWSLHLNLRVPAGAGKLISNFRKVSKIFEDEFVGEDWLASAVISPRLWDVLKPTLEMEGGCFEMIKGVEGLETL